MTILAMVAWLLIASGSTAAQEWHSMVFRADAPGVDENPLRGLVPYAVAQRDANGFPHSMEWFSLPLSAVVTGPMSTTGLRCSGSLG